MFVPKYEKYSKTCLNGHSQKDLKLVFKASITRCRSKVLQNAPRATLKKTKNWFSRPIITFCRSKKLQNASSKESILQYFGPSLIYHLSLRSLFCLFSTGFTVLPEIEAFGDVTHFTVKNASFCPYYGQFFFYMGLLRVVQ